MKSNRKNNAKNYDDIFLESEAIIFEQINNIALENKYYDKKIFRENIENLLGFEGSFAIFLYLLDKYRHKRRASGEATILHPIKTSLFLKKHNSNIETIITGLLHDILEDEFKIKLNNLTDLLITYLNEKYILKNIEYANSLEKQIERYHSELSNYDKNKEITDIRNLLSSINIKKNSEKKIINDLKYLSFAYKIPSPTKGKIMSLKDEYNLKRYGDYINEIVKLMKHNISPLQVKIADRWHNTITLQGLDFSKIKRTLLKNQILIDAITKYLETENFKLDETTISMLNDLKKAISYERKKDYRELFITIQYQEDLNQISDNIIHTIDKIDFNKIDAKTTAIKKADEKEANYQNYQTLYIM